MFSIFISTHFSSLFDFVEISLLVSGSAKGMHVLSIYLSLNLTLDTPLSIFCFCSGSEVLQPFSHGLSDLLLQSCPLSANNPSGNRLLVEIYYP
jgi:hypothetical protein